MNVVYSQIYLCTNIFFSCLDIEKKTEQERIFFILFRSRYQTYVLPVKEFIKGIHIFEFHIKKIRL